MELSEFKAAIVPTETPTRIIETLKKTWHYKY